MWPTSRHRVLFNADTNFLFHNIYPPYETDGTFDIAMITDYVNMLADSGVDTLLINANCQVPWYVSKKLPDILEGYKRGDYEYFFSQFPPLADDFTSEQRDKISKRYARILDRCLDLKEAGIDWVQSMIETCHQRGMSPWVSVRMNDAHGANNWNESFMNCAPQRDPACRLQGLHESTPGVLHNERQLMNYGMEPVRDYMYSLVDDLLTQYDFDGMELDWVRTAHCCEPPATQADIHTMSQWHASIRQLANERFASKPKSQHRPSDSSFTLGMRVPARVRSMRTIGIDVFEIARQGDIDFIGPSNFWQTTWDVAVDDLRAKLPAEVAVLGVVDDAPNWLDAKTQDGQRKGTRMLSASPELLRGNAAGKLASGSPAIETYNFFCSDEQDARNPHKDRRQGAYPILAELSSLDTLRGKTKQYSLASMNGGWMYPLFESSEQLPVIIPAGQRKVMRLCMASEPADAGLKLVVQVVINKENQTTPVNEIGVSFNGTWPEYELQSTDKLLFPTGTYTHHLEGHIAFNLRLDAQLIEDGWNEVLVFNAHESQSIEVISVELAVDKA